MFGIVVVFRRSPQNEQVHFSTSSDDSSVFHSEVDFRFKTYAPPAFDHFRVYFGVSQEDFCSPLRELSSSGASGSLFYISKDDEFILKTVQRRKTTTSPSSGRLLSKSETKSRTLLPKFFGLYNYIPKTGGNKNIRFVVMNNVLPSALKMDWKYDLKGSTYNRRASLAEKMKPYPTFKDLDFVEHFPGGLILEEATYNALMRTLERDANVLESLKIMDYSLLIGIHSLDLAASENSRQMQRPKEVEKDLEESKIQKRNRRKLVAHSTALESIEIELDDMDFEVPFGGIPARSRNGDNLLVFLGIIDILQSYRLSKKLEHTWKAVVYDGNTVSVHRPEFYARRFMDFLKSSVFCDRSRPIASNLDIKTEDGSVVSQPKKNILFMLHLKMVIKPIIQITN
ncbi:Phosphatidylinositol 4-phosphate 5-kinase type-1 beta [Orchesella cincta]|uniref:Phosphatidylinositol 4-phosphate 5-kinase type-1 beta n=1 Tax=Orchesella cincta TaxID=48709 RepID=A0A1D2M365_ORCCI|nr:Phosphatidylinositol 4-phosphate 5-kinase type-1 beta [Orchesella cincta]